MDENTELMLKKINRGIIANRIIGIVSLVILVGILGVAIFASVKVKQFIDEVEPVIEVLSEIDVEEFNATLHTVNQVVDVLKIDETMEMLSQIDFQAFNDVVNGINVDDLNTTLDHMNEAYVAIKDISDKLKPLLSLFGGKR